MPFPSCRGNTTAVVRSSTDCTSAHSPTAPCLLTSPSQRVPSIAPRTAPRPASSIAGYRPVVDRSVTNARMASMSDGSRGSYRLGGRQREVAAHLPCDYRHPPHSHVRVLSDGGESGCSQDGRVGDQPIGRVAGPESCGRIGARCRHDDAVRHRRDPFQVAGAKSPYDVLKDAAHAMGQELLSGRQEDVDGLFGRRHALEGVAPCTRSEEESAPHIVSCEVRKAQQVRQPPAQRALAATRNTSDEDRSRPTHRSPARDGARSTPLKHCSRAVEAIVRQATSCHRSTSILERRGPAAWWLQSAAAAASRSAKTSPAQSIAVSAVGNPA